MYIKFFFNIIRILSASIFVSIPFSQITITDSFQSKSNRFLNNIDENWETLSFFNNYNFDTKKIIFSEESLINQSFSFNFIKNNFSLLYFNKLSHKNLFAYSYLSLGDETGFLSSHQEIDIDRIKNDVNQFKMLYSGFGYRNNWVLLKISKDRENWGSGKDIQLALSKTSEPYNYLTIASDYGFIRVKYIHGFLESTNNLVNRFITARGLEWTNKKSLIIGFSETIIYSGLNRSFDIGYLNPISSHIEVELNNRLNKVGDRNSNAIWQFHLEALVKKNIRLSLNYLIDEFVLDPDQEVGKEHGYAYSLSISKSVINHKNKYFSIYSNYIHIGTPTFRHGNGENNFINNMYPIGWFKGSDSKQFSLGCNYSNKSLVLCTLNSGVIHSGEESIRNRPFDSYSDYIKGPFPSGKVKEILFLNVSLDLNLNKSFVLRFLVNLKNEKYNDVLIGVGSSFFF